MDHYARSLRNCFAAYALNRLTHKRQDDAWVAERLVDVDTRFVPVWRSRNLVTAGEASPRPVWLSFEQLGQEIQRAESLTLLGEVKGRVYFSVGLPAAESPPASLDGIGQFRDLRRFGALLDEWAGTLLAYARAISYWHQRHRFCGDCGSPTVSTSGGHLRVCTDEQCGQHHFPRTDPAIIVLVASGERCLLGRQAAWPKNMYSTIAGFVEPGESLEAAVVREVLEETGVQVGAVQYHSSQPWPFPSSLMLGFTAQATSEAIRLNDGELENARWFSREEIQSALQGQALRLPSNVSISYRLIETWFDAGTLGWLRDKVRG